MRVLIVVAAASLVFGAGTTRVLAQSPQASSTERRFDVASVKPGLSPAEAGAQAGRAAASGAPVPMPRFGIQTQPGGRFLAGSSLKQLIAEAFEVKDYQIQGGPPWLATNYFEVTANAGADATPADVKAMLRTLLAERFGLRTHSDTRQAPVYVLTVARSDGRLGSQLKSTTPECLQQIEQRKNGTAAPSPPPPPPPNPRDPRIEPRCGVMSMMGRATGATMIAFGGMELTSLVSHISSQLSAPVIDQTGLSGRYDIVLEYLSERGFGGRPPGLDPNSTEPLPVPLVGALQQQLGLKLEKQIGPMPVVIIDAAEQPTPD